MGLSPWYVGQTYPALQITLNNDSGSDNVSGLAPSNFTLILRNLGTTSDTTGTGTFVIVNANPAIVTYAFSSSDVATAGSYLLILKVTFPSGLKVYDPVPFTLTAI
jgi:hypothetical protein